MSSLRKETLSILAAVAREPSLFLASQTIARQAAEKIIQCEITSGSLEVGTARRLRDAVGVEAFEQAFDVLASAKLKAVLKKLDPHFKPSADMDAAALRRRIFDLVAGRLAPLTMPLTQIISALTRNGLDFDDAWRQRKEIGTDAIKLAFVSAPAPKLKAALRNLDPQFVAQDASAESLRHRLFGLIEHTIEPEGGPKSAWSQSAGAGVKVRAAE